MLDRFEPVDRYCQQLSKKNAVILLFAMALLLRFALISVSPKQENNCDLYIAMIGGGLLVNGVNPYIYSDNIQLRESMRNAKKADNPGVSQNQAQWDFYASSNPPLNLLFYGLISSISSKPSAYRIAYAIGDSLLSVMIGLFVIKYWKGGSSLRKWIWILALGALSPVLFYSGVIWPEDKGVEILLMVSAIYFAQSESNNLRKYLSAFMLGLSIAFKVLGIFLIPLCLYYVLARQSELQVKEKVKLSICYLSLSGLSSLIWLVPFWPESIDILFNSRLKTAVASAPVHASMWRIINLILPVKLFVIKYLTIATVVFVTAYGFIKKILNMEVVVASALILFSAIYLETGSLDRLNIAILVSLLLLGTNHEKGAAFLTKYYFIGGLIIFVLKVVIYLLQHSIVIQSTVIPLDNEYLDSLFVLLYVVFYFALLTKYLIHDRKVYSINRKLQIGF